MEAMNKYLQQVQAFLKAENISTRFNEEAQRFETTFSGESVDIETRMCYVEKSQKLEHIVFLDVKIPPEAESKMCVLINLLNDYLNVGNLMLTRQKYVICRECFFTNGNAELNSQQLDRLWYSPLNTMFDFAKVIMRVAFGDVDPHDAVARFWKEREDAQQKVEKKDKPQSLKETIKKWVRGISKN